MRRRGIAGQPLQRAPAGAARSARQVARLLPADACSGAPCAAGSRSAPCGCAPGHARRRRPDTGRARRLRASQGTSARSASAMARARTGSLPARSASRITPSGSVCDAPRSPAIQPHQLQRAAADIGQDAVGGRECRTARPRRSSAASSAPDSMRIGTPGRRAAAPATKPAPLRRVAHRGGGQHLERVGAHGARDGVVAVHHGEAPAPCRPRSAARWLTGRGPGAAPPSR